MESTRPLVSLIMVNYNGVGLLPPFFAALARTDYPHYETIVVDNASGDQSADYMRAKHPHVRLITNSENQGFGRACNQGAAIAQGALLLFLNPDVLVTPGWLTILVEHMRERPDAAIICPSTLYPGETLRAAEEQVTSVAAVPGAAMMLRRAAWEAIGGFDEQMFLYWEDTELCWRAWLLGWSVLWDRRAYVHHERGAITGSRRWDAERTKNSLYTYLKLMRWRRVVPFALLLALKTLVKLALLHDPALIEAWRWNFRQLGHTLAIRRELSQRRRVGPALLEAMIREQERQLRRARQARRVVQWYII